MPFRLSAFRRQTRRIALALALSTAAFAPSLPLFVPAPAWAAAEVAPDATAFTLGNGLEVVVIPDHRAPVVTHMVWYKVGSADESAGKSGIAHFLEHLMFKGTSNHPTGEFSKAVADVGGQENAFTSYDYTAYHQRVAKEHLALVMEFEADRMANLVLDDSVIAPERQVILEERSSRIDNDPGAQLGESVDAALYVNHPYGKPVIGWRDEMEGLTAEDAIAFYDRFYTPNNAVLVVAGDVTVDEVRKLAEETYGKVARRAEPPPRIRPEVQHLPATAVVSLTDDRVAQPSTRMSFLVPSYDSSDQKTGATLDVLAEILGGGSTGRLYRSLVLGDGPAVSAGAWYQGSSMNETEMSFYAVPRDGGDLADLESRIRAVVAKVAEEGVTAEELERARHGLVAEAVYAQDSQATLARIFGASLATGGTLDEVKQWPSVVETVTAEDVQAAAKRFLAGEPVVIARLLPAPAAAEAAGNPAPAETADDPAAAPSSEPQR